MTGVRYACVLLMIQILACGCSRTNANPPAARATSASAVAASSAPVQAMTNLNAASVAGAEVLTVQPVSAVALAATAPAAFVPESVPETTTPLPPFPFFKAPDGLVSNLDAKQRNASFDREHMIAGNKIIAVEGKVFRDRFSLVDPEHREYSAIEFQRNYENAIGELGGVKVSQVQFIPAVNDTFGGRDAVDSHYHGICASEDCENNTYLIRQGGKEYWILVSTGAIPLHGSVIVLERQGMKQSLGLLDAAAMKKALDTNGHVALYINFDTDKASLRPDAAPVINEIAKLLQGDSTLKLSIEGHTDNTGTADHNRSLSRARADSVRSALLAKGILADRLTSAGFGQDKPIADNASEVGRAKNRRVELVKR